MKKKGLFPKLFHTFNLVKVSSYKGAQFAYVKNEKEVKVKIANKLVSLKKRVNKVVEKVDGWKEVRGIKKRRDVAIVSQGEFGSGRFSVLEDEGDVEERIPQLDGLDDIEGDKVDVKSRSRNRRDGKVARVSMGRLERVERKFKENKKAARKAKMMEKGHEETVRRSPKKARAMGKASKKLQNRQKRELRRMKKIRSRGEKEEHSEEQVTEWDDVEEEEESVQKQLESEGGRGEKEKHPEEQVAEWDEVEEEEESVQKQTEQQQIADWKKINDRYPVKVPCPLMSDCQKKISAAKKK